MLVVFDNITETPLRIYIRSVYGSYQSGKDLAEKDADRFPDGYLLFKKSDYPAENFDVFFANITRDLLALRNRYSLSIDETIKQPLDAARASLSEAVKANQSLKIKLDDTSFNDEDLLSLSAECDDPELTELFTQFKAKKEYYDSNYTDELSKLDKLFLHDAENDSFSINFCYLYQFLSATLHESDHSKVIEEIQRIFLNPLCESLVKHTPENLLVFIGEKMNQGTGNLLPYMIFEHVDKKATDNCSMKSNTNDPRNTTIIIKPEELEVEHMVGFSEVFNENVGSTTPMSLATIHKFHIYESLDKENNLTLTQITVTGNNELTLKLNESKTYLKILHEIFIDFFKDSMFARSWLSGNASTFGQMFSDVQHFITGFHTLLLSRYLISADEFKKIKAFLDKVTEYANFKSDWSLIQDFISTKPSQVYLDAKEDALKHQLFLFFESKAYLSDILPIVSYLKYINVQESSFPIISFWGKVLELIEMGLELKLIKEELIAELDVNGLFCYLLALQQKIPPEMALKLGNALREIGEKANILSDEESAKTLLPPDGLPGLSTDAKATLKLFSDLKLEKSESFSFAKQTALRNGDRKVPCYSNDDVNKKIKAKKLYVKNFAILVPSKGVVLVTNGKSEPKTLSNDLSLNKRKDCVTQKRDPKNNPLTEILLLATQRFITCAKTSFISSVSLQWVGTKDAGSFIRYSALNIDASINSVLQRDKLMLLHAGMESRRDKVEFLKQCVESCLEDGNIKPEFEGIENEIKAVNSAFSLGFIIPDPKNKLLHDQTLKLLEDGLTSTSENKTEDLKKLVQSCLQGTGSIKSEYEGIKGKIEDINTTFVLGLTIKTAVNIQTARTQIEAKLNTLNATQIMLAPLPKVNPTPVI